MHPLDSLEDGYEQLRDLVISYLGLEDARIDAPRPNTSDEIKRLDDYDIQRSGTIEIRHANFHSLSRPQHRLISTVDQCDRLSKLFASIGRFADVSRHQSEHSIQVRRLGTTDHDVI